MELGHNSEPSEKSGGESNHIFLSHSSKQVTVLELKQLANDIDLFARVYSDFDSKKVLYLHGRLTQMEKRKRKATERQNARLFRLLELSARVLPLKVQSQAFEPAYYDVKAAYLKDRCQYHSKTARRWLRVCFILRVIVLLSQCLWGMCWETLKGRFVSFVLRRLFGA